MKPSFLRWLCAAGLLAPFCMTTCYDDPLPTNSALVTGVTGGDGGTGGDDGTGGTGGQPEDGAGGTGGEAGGAGGEGGGGPVVINEIVLNPLGTDAGCFIEIKGTPGASLDTLRLRAVNGNGGAIYNEFRFDATHTFDANGYFVVAQDSKVLLPPGAAFVIDGFADLQNGPDTVILTALGGVPIDAVAYSDDLGKYDPPNVNLGEGQFVIQPNGPYASKSLSRLPDGNDTGNNATDFVYGDLTPGAPNAAATGVGGDGGQGGQAGQGGDGGQAGNGGGGVGGEAGAGG